MKQRLLSLLAVCAMSVMAFAQWTAPVEPTSPLTPVDYVADGTSAYYLYNVGAGQFLIGANSWATQISLGTNGTAYMEIVVEPMDDAEAETYPDCVKLKLNGTFKFSGGNRTDFAVSNKYLFRDNESSGYVDRNNQAVWYWKFTKNEAGNYYWQSAPGMLENDEIKFPNSETQYAKGGNPGAPVIFNASIEDENIEWQFITAGTVSSAAMTEFTAQMAVYNARKDLYNELLKAAEYNVDYDDASAVYNNADATVEELVAAYEELSPKVAEAVVLALIPQSSEDNPLDITQYTIKNPNFDDGINHWTVTKTMGQNLGAQGNHVYTADDESAQLNNFIEAWYPVSTGALKDGVICQIVKGLPEGRYRIEADVMAVRQEKDFPIDDQYGIYLYYNNGSYTVKSESLSTEDGKPQHFTFDFDYSGAAEMTIGLMAENTNCNWMGMDNFKLFAIGECKDSPAWTALVVEYNEALAYSNKVDKAEAAIIQQLDEAIEAAEDLVGEASDKSKDAEYTAAFNAIKNAKAAVIASEAAYKKLASFIERLNAEDESYASKTGFAEFALNVIEPLLEECEAAYDEGTWTSEQIDAAIAAYEPKAKEFTKQIFDQAAASGETLEEPIDITALFDYMDFAYGTTQTAFANGYPAANEETGVTPVWMNETNTGNFKTNYSTVEVWNARPFNIYREFQNLPKGRYTIQTHAFFRAEANDANYANWQADADYGKNYAYIYAGENTESLINVASIACPEFENLNNPYDCTDGNFLPNNQQSAYRLFTEPEFAAQAEQCLVSVSGNVLNDGDVLRVGINGTNSLMDNHWTVWYGFTLLYHGAISGDALNDDLQKLIDAAAEANTCGVAEGLNKIEAAIDNGNKALLGSSDDKIAAMTALRDAIAYTEESDALVQKLTNMSQEYEMKASELPGSYTYDEYLNLINDINDAIGSEEFESNAAIQTWIDRLQNEWIDYVLSDEMMELATAEEPCDMTALITNASFDNSWDGWTYTASSGSPTIESASGNCAEFWNTGTFDIYQELPKLTEGYWRLEVDATYRPGNSGDVIAAMNVADSVLLDNEFFYIKGTGLNMSKKVVAWQDIVNGAIEYTLEEETPVYSAENQALIDAGIENAINCATDRYNFTAPNNRTQLKQFIAVGRYHNTIDFKYTPNNGAIRFGLCLKDLITVGSCWCPFDDFKLSFLGTEEPDAVRDINAAGANSLRNASIFSIDGRQQNSLKRGINIVRNADGKVQKVLVK